jgi:hypothetical protein
MTQKLLLVSSKEADLNKFSEHQVYIHVLSPDCRKKLQDKIASKSFENVVSSYSLEQR